MPTIWDVTAWEDYLAWGRKHPRTRNRINQLIREIQQQGHVGMGRPQPITGMAGYYQRRITDKHRLTYKVNGDDVLIAACRYQY